MRFFAGKMQPAHVCEVHEGQGEHDLAGHGGDAGEQVCPVIDGAPALQHEGGVAEVYEVVAYQQGAVDEVCEGGITLQQLQDEKAAVAVKEQAYAYGDKVGQEEINEIS